MGSARDENQKETEDNDEVDVTALKIRMKEVGSAESQIATCVFHRTIIFSYDGIKLSFYGSYFCCEV